EGKSSAYLAAGEPQRALRCLDRVIQIDPYDADAWRLRGDVLATSNQNEEALRSYDEALRQRDGDAIAWESRAKLLHKVGRNVDAKRQLLLASERWSELVATCDAILAIQPHHPRALKDKGRALLALGKAEEAHATFERLRVVAPDDLDALRGQRDALRHAKSAK